MSLLFADSNRARIRYIKESDSNWGTTPASGVTRELRFTGSTLTPNKSTAVSEEIRADRMVPDIIETAFKASGDVNVEFSAGSHDDFLEGFSYGAWTRPMGFDTVKGTAVTWGSTSKVYILGKDVSTYYTVGHRVKTAGFVNPANNNYWEISAISYNGGAARTEITMTETTAVIEAGSAYTAFYDANDVFVLRDTHIRSGTAGASAFDSNGNNSFAAAIAAGQLVSGQKIFVEALGFETGTVAFAAYGTAVITDGETVTVSDGVNTAVFQFGGAQVGSNIMVAKGAANTDAATNLAAAINALRPSGALNVSATVSTNTVTLKNVNQTGGSISKAGDTATNTTVTNFTGGQATARGIFTVSSAVDDTITVSPAPPTIANSTIEVTIKGSMLRNPDEADIVPHSFSLETEFSDISQWRIIDGQRVSTFAYNIAAGSILTGSFGFSGRGMSKLLATKLGNTGSYTVLDTTATPVANATVDVGTIFMDGAALSTALKTIALNGTNNLRDQDAVGNKFPAGIGAGRIEISGTVDAYFADASLWDKFIDHDTVSLGWSIQDVDSNHYEWTIPAAVFSTDTANPAGGNQDIMENVGFTAKRDPVTDCVFQIDRFSPLTAVSA